jgi:hypothetical protein
MPHRSRAIDAIIAATPDWRGATLARLRTIVQEADPEITETVKWRKPSNPLGSAVFEHDGIVCIGILLKERVRLAFEHGASLPDPEKMFNAQLEGKVSRALDFHEGEAPKKTTLKALIRAAVEHNRAHAKRARKER